MNSFSSLTVISECFLLLPRLLSIMIWFGAVACACVYAFGYNTFKWIFHAWITLLRSISFSFSLHLLLLFKTNYEANEMLVHATQTNINKNSLYSFESIEFKIVRSYSISCRGNSVRNIYVIQIWQAVMENTNESQVQGWQRGSCDCITVYLRFNGSLFRSIFSLFTLEWNAPVLYVKWSGISSAGKFLTIWNH